MAGFASEMELDALERAFRNRTLPHGQWTHSAHLAMATVFNLEGDFDPAVARIRDAIQALNTAHGVATTLERGYHETFTVAWMAHVRSLIGTMEPGLPRHEIANRILDLCADKYLLDRYYSPERLRSAEARFGFAEPDREPLPLLGHNPATP